MKRIFLDTNVVLDYVLQRHPWHVEAQSVWEQIANGKMEGFISAITPLNISYIVRKSFEPSVMLALLNDLYDALEIIPLDHTILRAGLVSPINDYEDAVNEISAVQARVEVILTRDVNDFKKARLPVMTPDNFVIQYLRR